MTSKQLRLVLILVCSSLSLFAQQSRYKNFNIYKNDTINIIDKKGNRQGVWIKFYEADKIYYKGQFKDNSPIGVFSYYAKDGTLNATNRFYKGGKRSFYTEYYDYKSGVLKSSGVYQDEKMDSTWNYYNTVGVLRKSESYKNGKKEGPWITYFSDGSVLEELHWKNGEKDGPWKRYYTNGKPRLEGTYVSGNFVGYVRAFHDNGNPWVLGKYKNGLKDSIWTYYREMEKGVIEHTDTYSTGVLKSPLPADEMVDDDDGEEDIIPGSIKETKLKKEGKLNKKP